MEAYNHEMDSHSFGEPKLLSPDDELIETSSGVKDALNWSIDVLRRGDEVVGTLVVNTKNFPPRFKKKKVIWQLPTDPSILPRFGSHEKDRLWELYKLQRKERRKKSKNQEDSQSRQEDELASNGDAAPSTEQEPGRIADSTMSSMTPTVSAGISTQQVLQNTQCDHKGMDTVPPPPGFASGVNAPITQSTLTIPLDMPASEPSPGLSSPVIPPPPGILVHAVATMNDFSGLIPPRYFTNGTSDIGRIVGSIFLHCMTSRSVKEWLGYYFFCHHENINNLSTSTLLMRQAQAVCHSVMDRVTQWSRLSTGAQWDCQGVSTQRVVGSAKGAESTLLVVLSGVTVQSSIGSLSYSLSLILQLQEGGYQIVNDVLSLFTLPGST